MTDHRPECPRTQAWDIGGVPCTCDYQERLEESMADQLAEIIDIWRGLFAAAERSKAGTMMVDVMEAKAIVARIDELEAEVEKWQEKWHAAWKKDPKADN